MTPSLHEPCDWCPLCGVNGIFLSEGICADCRTRTRIAEQPTVLLTIPAPPAAWQKLREDVARGYLTDFFAFHNEDYGVTVPAGNHYDNMRFPWICFHDGCMIRYSPKLYIEAYSTGSLMPCGHGCDEVQEVIA